jgi:competence protein ComEA
MNHCRVAAVFTLTALGCVTGCTPHTPVSPDVPEATERPAPETDSPLVGGKSTDTIPAIPVPTLMVEVQGAVVRPGAYEMSAGSRVQDVLMRAGGTTAGALVDDLNIAARLIDGSVLTIPYQASGEGAAAYNPPAYTRSGGEGTHARAGTEARPEVPGTSGDRPPAPVNVNTATQAELERIPGVGPKTAEKIIRFREQQPIRNLDDLKHVQGIGEKRLESLRPYLRAQ